SPPPCPRASSPDRSPPGAARAPPARRRRVRPRGSGRAGGRPCSCPRLGLGGQRRLVEEEPVVAELLHYLAELVEVHGLDDVTVDAQLVSLGDIPFLFC